MDQPNQRSLHSLPVPPQRRHRDCHRDARRLDLSQQSTPLLMLLALVLAGISYTDDWKGLPVAVRLVVHGLAAAVLVWSGLAGHHRDLWLATALVGYIVWMTNAYNFMGWRRWLAGGMAVFGFSAYGLAACRRASGSFGGNGVSPWRRRPQDFCLSTFLRRRYSWAMSVPSHWDSLPRCWVSWGWQQEAWPLWVPGPGFFPVPGRCQRDPAATHDSRRAFLASAS